VSVLARYRLLAGTALGVALVLVAWFGLRSTGRDESASANGSSSASRSANPAASLAHRGPTRRLDLRSGFVAPAVEAPVESATPPTSMVVPIPSRLGGGKSVSSSTTALANRLQLVPAELADLAEEPGGDVPQHIARELEDAHARGTALGDRLGLDPPDAELLAGRFTNQLVRLERQLRQSPHGVTFEDVSEMVTRDTLQDLRSNLGEDVAKAAESDVRGLKPLQTPR
jgi:hypothetical protein